MFLFDTLSYDHHYGIYTLIFPLALMNCKINIIFLRMSKWNIYNLIFNSIKIMYKTEDYDNGFLDCCCKRVTVPL